MLRLKAPQRRHQLMTVATRLFAKRGYEATTTAAIADAAGVTEPILYRHFKGKQELFVAIVRDMCDQTLRHFHDLAAPIPDPAEKLRVIARGFPDHLHRLSDAYQVIHGALATSRDRKVLAVIREHYSRIEDFFADLIRQGQHSGVFRAQDDPHSHAWHLINLGIGFAMISLNLPHLDNPGGIEAIESVVRGLKN
ncbi:MAG TPA: TetR/AcrR family transcriptional regulator [Tepidisphaeraceae bacterium]|nr:TetR/AcrR family transcriptional regulator [Tepidisphaeraceae bacterium]